MYTGISSIFEQEEDFEKYLAKENLRKTCKNFREMVNTSDDVAMVGNVINKIPILLRAYNEYKLYENNKKLTMAFEEEMK